MTRDLWYGICDLNKRMLRTRVVLVDDHRILLDALRSLVEPEFHVIEIFDNCPALIENAEELNPDIIVLDIGMPLMNGLSAAEHLKKLLPKTKLIFLTANEDIKTASKASKLGRLAMCLRHPPVLI